MWNSGIVTWDEGSVQWNIGRNNHFTVPYYIDFNGISGGFLNATIPIFTIELNSELITNGSFNLNTPEFILEAVQTSGNLSINFPDYSLELRSVNTGLFNLKAPRFSLRLTTDVLPMGVFNLRYPRRSVHMYTFHITEGIFNITVPDREISFSGGIDTSGVFAIQIPRVSFDLHTLLTEPFVIVMNIDNGAGPTFYGNFDFNSMFQYGEDIYLATTLGMYKLTGMTDGGVNINANFTLPEVDLGVPELKRVEEITVGMRGGVLQIQTSHDGVLTSAQRTLATPNKLLTRRINPAKGLKQRYWGIKVSNYEGSNFLVDDLTLYPFVTKRRINQ